MLAASDEEAKVRERDSPHALRVRIAL